MAESRGHITLVDALVSFVAKTYCDGNASIVFTDSSGTTHMGRSPSISGFVPDAYLSFEATTVVGEAKTDRDLENSHCIDQLEAFLAFCSGSSRAVFIFAVPWYRVPYAKNLLTYLCCEGKFRNDCWHVLENLPG